MEMSFAVICPLLGRRRHHRTRERTNTFRWPTQFVKENPKPVSVHARLCRIYFSHSGLAHSELTNRRLGTVRRGVTCTDKSSVGMKHSPPMKGVNYEIQVASISFVPRCRAFRHFHPGARAPWFCRP